MGQAMPAVSDQQDPKRIEFQTWENTNCRSMTESNAVIILITVPNDDSAERIAAKLIAERLAACVNVIPGIVSHYRWEGKLNADRELLLLVKTQSRHFNAVRDAVLEIHPYDLPEIIAIDVVNGLKGYLDWVMRETVTN